VDGKTFKMTRLVGESSSSIEDAIKTALRTSGKAVRGHNWARIIDLRANLGEDASIDRWQATVEVAFEVEEDA
jgi:flavin-binding protein dodecin